MKIQDETMSPEEKLAAVGNLKESLEENFLSLGQLLSEIKRSRLFLFRGYEKFKDFVEAEYQLSSSLAGKLAKIYDMFVGEMDLGEDSIKDIGYDRLGMVLPMINNADWETRDEWVKKAEQFPTKDLRDHIKALKQQEKDSNMDLKEVYVEQYLEKMLSWFNCSRKELNFKLALYFQDVDMDAVKNAVKERQRLFEQRVTSPEQQG